MKKWNILGEYNIDNDIINTLLSLRGINSTLERREYLGYSDLNSLLQQTSLEFRKSLIQGKELISLAIEHKIPIVIHGDYDTDGICATAILYKTLKRELGYNQVYYFIPNRFEHGYGLSKKSIDAAIARVTDDIGIPPKEILFVTVDSGITSVVEVQYINSLGCKVVITDHHQKPNILPEAACILWQDVLVGTSIAWILSRALGSKDTQSIGLCALATVTDLQPVVGFNRYFVKKGLDILNKDLNLGLQKLITIAGKGAREITTYDLGWVIGPRLNASGRLVNADISLKLLIEEDPVQLEKYAWELNKVNAERQDITTSMFELSGVTHLESIPRIFISERDDYHEGIIGLVAARIAQLYYRPAVVISLSDEFGKGSVRSIPGINIISILRDFEHLFVSLGGHPMAAGFTIPRVNIPTLTSNLRQYFDTIDDSTLFEPKLDVDLRIPLDVLDLNLIAKVKELEPFGIGNKEPVFMSESVGLLDFRVVGKDEKHVSLKFYKNGKTFKAIFFSNRAYFESFNFKVGDTLDIVYTANIGNYNNMDYVNIELTDLRKSEDTVNKLN